MRARRLGVGLGLFVVSGALFAADGAAAMPQAEDDVTPLELEGVFVGPPPEQRRLVVPAGVGPVELRFAAATGRVRAGDRLLELEAVGLEERRQALAGSLEQLHLRQERSRLTRELSEERFLRRLHDAKVELQQAERAQREFREIDAPEQRSELESQLRDWDVNWDEARAQLDLVEAMYQADGRIEEAERIDLNSRRRSMERRTKGRSRLETSWRILTEQTLPSREAELELATRQAMLAVRRVEAANVGMEELQSIEVQRERQALRQAEKELQELEDFAESLEWRAEDDGVFEVVDSVLRRAGEEGGAEGARVELQGGLLARLHRSAPAKVRVMVPEARVRQVHVGDAVTVRPKSAPSVELPATVERVEALSSEGEVAVWLLCRVRHERVLAGWGARVEF